MLAGALHYFGVHPHQWRHRIRTARLMGLNTIETYAPWNEHVRRHGAFNLPGRLDLGRFLDEVAAQGMFAIVRPGPYICAEWDNGGLPASLFGVSLLGLRARSPTSSQRWTKTSTSCARARAPSGRPRRLHHPRTDRERVRCVRGRRGVPATAVRLNRAIGLTVPFTTVNQPTDGMLANGSLPEFRRRARSGDALGNDLRRCVATSRRGR